jgi:hypothetical protein
MFEIPLVNVGDCQNFDAVTKRVKSEARRIVMAEILATEAEEEEENGDKEEQQEVG